MTTLTGTYQLPDGTPAAGHVEIIPSEKKILDADGKVILSGRAHVPLVVREWPKLDANGEPVLDAGGEPVMERGGSFSVDLPATDDPTLNPTGFGYTLVAKMNHTHLRPVSFSLPADPATVDIVDLDTVDPASFTPDVTYATGTDLADVADRVAELEAAPAPVTSWSELEDKPETFKPDVTDPDLSATYAALDPVTGAVLDGSGQPVEGAGDAEVAALLNTTGSASRTAVEGVVADAPTVTAAAAAAVDDELATRDLLEGPTETDAGVLVSIRDASDHRTFLEANAEDGGPTHYAASLIAAALGVDPPVEVATYVASGDSMTSDAYGGGTTYPAKLAALLGKSVVNNGSGGRRASEVAIVAGGLAFPIAIPGGTIPAATTTVAVTPTLPDPGPGADRTFNVTVQGVVCTLTYTLATTTWTLARKVAAGAATPVPKTGAVAVPTTAYGAAGHIHILWGGRNNVPKSTADEPMIAAAQWCKDNDLPFLLVSVCNATSETSGTSGYNDIIALNAELRNAFPREYVELRGRLIVQGLALAGLTATGTDTTDIANDCIPTSLLADGLHPNNNGRVAIAAIIHDELTIRGLA